MKKDGRKKIYIIHWNGNRILYCCIDSSLCFNDDISFNILNLSKQIVIQVIEIHEKINNMGFFSNIISSVVKVALTPVAIVKDIANVVTDEEIDATKSLLESAKDDADEATQDLSDGDL